MDRLVAYLIETGMLRTPEIIEAFRVIDRKDFVPAKYADEAYGDYPLPIGFGQTISQPTTVAFMLELLAPRKGNRVLDVGSGSGWTTALLARVVGLTGSVQGIERVTELVLMGQQNLAKYHFANATITEAGNRLGLPASAPPALRPLEGFDRILVSAAAERLPAELVNQLRVGGALVIPVGSAVWKVERAGGTKTRIEKFEGFSFVPLVGA